jgi:type II secretory pathway component GspD/PulD (secretin)
MELPLRATPERLFRGGGHLNPWKGTMQTSTLWTVGNDVHPSSLARWAMVTAAGMCLSVTSLSAQGQPAVTAQPTPVPLGPTGTPLNPNATGRQPSPAGNGGAPNAAAAGSANNPSEIPVDGEMVTFSAFAEPVELSTLVDYAAKALGINISIKSNLTGTIVFNAPVSVPKSRLIPLLSSLLEQQGFTLTYDASSTFYSVVNQNEIGVNLSGELPTTRVFSTPNLKPSSVKQALTEQLMAAAGGQGSQTKVSAIDEMGVLIATDTPKKLAALEALITRLLDEYGKSKFIRLELKHVAAPVARERVLQLLGQVAQPRPGSGNPGEVPQPVQPQQGGTNRLESIGDRLTIDPQGNALIFRGVEAETNQVRAVLDVIDVLNQLVPKKYTVGNAAKQVADIARNRGLGEVVTIEAQNTGQPTYNYNYNYGDQSGNARGRTGSTSVGGPVMVVDEGRGTIIYYGTPEQQEQLERLISGLDLEQEAVVIRNYKLKNADAEKVADLVQGLIQNRAPNREDSSLLPGGNGRGMNAQPNVIMVNPAGEGGNNELSLGNGSNVFVLADKANNQILVKAPMKQQPDFKRLLERLDLRRPQVYIETKIVAVTWSDDLRLAFETQLINSGGTGGVLNTNFGLSSFGTNGNLTQPKNVATGLGGATLALIKSDQVPIIMTALAKETDSRIVSSPQILVDDNEEASIDSVDKVPYAQTNQSTSTTTTSLGGTSEAGTKLKVKPQISEGGYLRLKYEAELSSFTGAATQGLPPPSQNNNVKSDAVTVPSDFTIVVGGLTYDSTTKNYDRIPGLGDIPIIGRLFGDTRDNKRKTTLYIFMTPRIMRDPNFHDVRLLTEGPQSKSQVPKHLPDLSPTSIEIIDTTYGSPADANRPKSLPKTAEDEKLGAPPAQPASSGNSGAPR